MKSITIKGNTLIKDIEQKLQLILQISCKITNLV